MADDRKINSGVWVEGVLYTEPDELEKVADADMITRLTEQGAISGSFKGAKKAEKKEKAEK